MDWIDTLSDINYWGVFLAIVSTFAVGMVWYAESVFGKTWMKLTGLRKKDVENKEKMMQGMLQSLVASIISAVVLASLMFATRTDGWADGAVFGGVVGFGIAMAAMVTHDAFAQVNMKLTKINGMHDVVSFAVMGGIIGGVGF